MRSALSACARIGATLLLRSALEISAIGTPWAVLLGAVLPAADVKLHVPTWQS